MKAGAVIVNIASVAGEKVCGGLGIRWLAGTTAADMDLDMMGAMATHSNLRTQPCMAEDGANIALFLAGDESRALTGQVLVSDFGAML